jgi:tetratricopeptide (TPR) repeat protein
VVLLALTTPARAQSTWSRATHPDARTARDVMVRAGIDLARAELSRNRRVRVMAPGDEAVGSMLLVRRALSGYEEAAALAPYDPQPVAYAAVLHEELGDSRGAIMRGERALALAAEFPLRQLLLNTLALAYTRVNRHGDARDAYLAALEYPSHARARTITLGNLGDTYMALRDAPRAVEAFRAAVEAEPAYELAWLGLAVAIDRNNLDASDALTHAVDTASMSMATPSTPGGTRPEALLDRLDDPNVFFVPAAERRYHEALAWMVSMREHSPRGRVPDAAQSGVCQRAAIASWRAYLAETADDDPYRSRARDHLRELGVAAAEFP